MASKTITFIPSVCKTTTDKKTNVVIEPTFKGTITLRKLTLDEKYAVLEACGIQVEEGPDGTSAKVPEGALSTIRKLVAASRKHYEAVDLTRLSDGEHFTSVDDLDTEDDCHAIMTEVANRMVVGFKLGNESKPQ